MLEDDAAFIETDRAQKSKTWWIGLRTPTHLYGMKLGKDSRQIEDERFMFFDMRQDPWQISNLLETGDQQNMAADLRERLCEWNERTPWLDVSTSAGPYRESPFLSR